MTRARRFRPGPGAVFAGALLAAIVAGLSQDWQDRGREAWSDLTAPPEQIIRGNAVVIDGDTLEIGNRRVRLFGIDAIEGQQTCTTDAGQSWPCGQEAAQRLAQRIGNDPVSCMIRDTDRYSRAVAECEADGSSLNYWMVERGWAIAYTRYSTRYAGAEREARAARRGIFSGSFIDPETWRSDRRD